jgi:hypothetical protein
MEQDTAIHTIKIQLMVGFDFFLPSTAKRKGVKQKNNSYKSFNDLKID